MRLQRIVIAAAFALFPVSEACAAPNPTKAPCAAAPADCSGEDAQRLNTAFFSDLTTDDQRARMRAIIAAKTLSGRVDWSAAASEYFAWRAQAMGYDPHPATPPIYQQYKRSEADRRRTEAERQRTLRAAAEAAVRARLVDPDSARFEWPYGFMQGSWKPLLQRRISGNVTCGTVNARNRMGGYAGSSSFVVVLDDSGVPLFVDVGSGDRYDLVEAQCEKAAASFPAPPADLEQSPAPANPSLSVADEIAKLAALRDRGILTQGEFEAQKAKLLGEDH